MDGKEWTTANLNVNTSNAVLGGIRFVDGK
jgi:hypothetical protein